MVLFGVSITNLLSFVVDGEYVVGGCNNEEAGDKYEIYFWNTTTGELSLSLSWSCFHQI